MRDRNGFAKKAAMLLVGMVISFTAIAAVSGSTVNAAKVSDLNLTQTGEIDLTLTDINGAVVSGGAVAIYQVAELYLDDGNMAYRYTDDFEDCKTDLDVTDVSLAEALMNYLEEFAKENPKEPITGLEEKIGADGKVSFTDLTSGLYLVVQTEESDSHEAFNPFVVTVPIENGETWDYSVDVSPKVGPLTPSEEQSEPQSESELVTEAGTKTTTESESEPATETTTLPQTGQLNWPIPVLTVGGALLLLVGLILKKAGNKKGNYES